MNGQERIVSASGKVINYTLIRKRIKAVHLRVTKDCKVVVSAPMFFLAEKADKFVAANEKFILERLKTLAGENALSTLSDGETVTVFGKKYSVVCSRGKSAVFIEGDKLVVVTKNGEEEEKRRAFEKYVRGECGKVFFYYVEKYYPYFKRYVGDDPPSISMRNASSRWGSCTPSKNRIMLSLRLFSKPVEAIECVVVHEYCHYIHLNHSKAFYSEMEKILPDRKTREKLL